MIKIKVNDQKEFDISFKNGQIHLNDKPFTGEFIKINDYCYHLIHEHLSLDIIILSKDAEKGFYQLKIGNTIHRIQAIDKFDYFLTKLGLEKAEKIERDIVAPMPGLVLEVQVKVGQEVAEGDTLMTLEAMKMENSIKSTRAGHIEKVYVEKGKNVDKDEILISYK